MKTATWLAIAVLSLLGAANMRAQGNRPEMTLHEEPLLGDRGLTRMLYWNEIKDSPIAGVSIDFGRPAWNRQLDDPLRFDALTKGRVWRLGNDYWTTLDSNAPLKIGGRDIPIGLWYLGLQRSADGSAWNLVFIDPVKARAGRLDPHDMSAAPIEFRAPLTVEPPAGFAEKLTIVLAGEKANIRNGTLRISWGKVQLVAPIQIVPEN